MLDDHENPLNYYVDKIAKKHSEMINEITIKKLYEIPFKMSMVGEHDIASKLNEELRLLNKGNQNQALNNIKKILSRHGFEIELKHPKYNVDFDENENEVRATFSSEDIKMVIRKILFEV